MMKMTYMGRALTLVALAGLGGGAARHASAAAHGGSGSTTSVTHGDDPAHARDTRREDHGGHDGHDGGSDG